MISETTGAGRLTKQPESWLNIPDRREYTPILLLGVAASQIQTCVAPTALAVVFAAHAALRALGYVLPRLWSCIRDVHLELKSFICDLPTKSREFRYQS
jgi:hypothetical protein